VWVDAVARLALADDHPMCTEKDPVLSLSLFPISDATTLD